MKKRKIIVNIVLVIIAILIILIVIRAFSFKQLDDVSPDRLCEEQFLNKSNIFLVIPLLNNQSIAENSQWCNYILSFNKTLALHGIYHTPSEFKTQRDEEYIKKGMEEFKKCFGFTPAIFQAPELKLSKENKLLLKKLNLTIIGWPNYITHKAYHCTDKEKTSWLAKLNTFNNIF